MLASMARKKDPNLPGLVQCNVRMPEPVLEELDAWADELNREVGWEKFTRSDLIRNCVDQALEARRKKGSAR